MAKKNIKIGLIGTGMIGMSNAAMFTGNGYETIVLAVNDDFIKGGQASYDSIYENLKDRGLVSEAQAKACRSLLSFTLDYADLADCTVFFESAFEKIEVKTEIYSNIEQNCPNCRAIASTSSAISPDDLASGISKYDDRVVVAHPFNPPHVVPFVEMVRGQKTTQEAVDLVKEVLESCGRNVCIMEKAAPGFIANRLQHALLREAFYMVDQGMCSARDIDKALMYSLMPRYTSIGLFEHQDAAGLDLVCNIETYLNQYLCSEPDCPAFVKRAVEEGNLGQKTGQGVYKWDEASIADFKVRSMAPFWKYFNWDLPEA